MNGLILATLLVGSLISAVSGNALDDYVFKPDAAYGWVDMGEEFVIRGSVDKRGWTGYVLNMTSLKWLTDEDFSATSDGGSLWWHYLVVIVPDEIKYANNGTLWITGGSVTSGPPSATDEDIVLSAALASSTGTVTGALFGVPNEHLTFSSDPIQQSRTEDAIIAFTWDHFLKDPSNPEWLLRFPMVKSSVRAMDAVREFMDQKMPEKNTKLDYYTVSGASKRGWTTWLVGAVDPTRVMAIIPVVLDAINFVAVEHHQFRAYGAWTYALEDYTALNMTERFDSPNMVTLQENVDPYWYRERLTMPKFVINACMDEFQQPDDTHYWWKDMPSPKHFLLIPNAEHSLATGILAAVPAISAWLTATLQKDTVPTFEWVIDDVTGDIVVTLDDVGKVHEVNMWYAQSCGVNHWDGDKNRRDFRVAHLDDPCSCGPLASGYCTNLASVWSKKTLEQTMVRGKRVYTASQPAPTDGTYTAFLVDVRYHNPNNVEGSITIDPVALAKSIVPRTENNFSERELRSRRAAQSALDSIDYERRFAGFDKDLRRFYEFTTEVSIVPNTFPYPDCTGESCGVQLV